MKEIPYEDYFWQNDLVRLRAWTSDDWEWDYRTNYDSESSRLADCELYLPPTEAASQEFSERIKDLSSTYNRTYFAIETLDGTLVGRTNILQDDHIHGTFAISTMIHRDYRGKGYGTASMKIMLKYGFMERRLNKYCGSIIEGNTGSIAMHEKLGCVQEGFCKENIYTNGKYYAEVLYGLTKDMYLNL